MALLALRRPRNLAALLVPYVALLATAALIGAFAPALALGAVMLAASPAELAAPALAARLGGRVETAAAIVVGTLVLSLAFLMSVVGPAGAAQPTVGMAFVGFALGVVLGGSAPRLRDALLPALRAASGLALAILVIGALLAAVPAVRPDTAIAGLALLAAGTVAALFVTAVLGGDRPAVVLGGGTRDFAVAATVAASASGAAAAAVPLAYGAWLFGAVAVIALWRRTRP